MHNFESILSNELRNVAFQTGHEYAWNRSDARRVLAICRQSEIACLGVDVWIPCKTGPLVTFHEFDSSRHQTGQTWAEHCYESCEASASYVKSFAWDQDDVDFRSHEPYFNLCMVNEQELNELGRKK